jgi:hypothetical protein
MAARSHGGTSFESGTLWALWRRCVLRVRCDHFRARCDSGMRDACDDVLQVPEHFSKVPTLPP